MSGKKEKDPVAHGRRRVFFFCEYLPEKAAIPLSFRE